MGQPELAPINEEPENNNNDEVKHAKTTRNANSEYLKAGAPSDFKSMGPSDLEKSEITVVPVMEPKITKEPESIPVVKTEVNIPMGVSQEISEVSVTSAKQP